MPRKDQSSVSFVDVGVLPGLNPYLVNGNDSRADHVAEVIDRVRVEVALA